MPGAKDMRDELRKLRKETMKPVSRMKMGDCAKEIESLRNKRETTPSVASMPVDDKPKTMMPKMANVKDMKSAEFPTKPVDMKEKMAMLRAKKGSAKVEDSKKAPAKKNKLEKLMSMLGDMTDSDQE